MPQMAISERCLFDRGSFTLEIHQGNIKQATDRDEGIHRLARLYMVAILGERSSTGAILTAILLHLTLLHSERIKLHRVLAFLSAPGLIYHCPADCKLMKNL